MSLKAKVAFTLPISCQICLGKVKEPVCCVNNHVFCKPCVSIWTEKNKQCPTCRVDVSDAESFRQLIGGGCTDDSVDSFCDSAVRKARWMSLFNNYEDEITRLDNKIQSLVANNDDLQNQLSSLTASNSTSSSAPIDENLKTRLESLERLLSESELSHHHALTEIDRLNQENGRLNSINADLLIQNERLRYEVSVSSPRKGFGSRFTMAALENQISDYRKEVTGLEKALQANDNYISELQARLEGMSTCPGCTNNRKTPQHIAHTRSSVPTTSTNATSQGQGQASDVVDVTAASITKADAPTSSGGISLTGHVSSATNHNQCKGKLAENSGIATFSCNDRKRNVSGQPLHSQEQSLPRKLSFSNMPSAGSSVIDKFRDSRLEMDTQSDDKCVEGIVQSITEYLVQTVCQNISLDTS